MALAGAYAFAGDDLPSAPIGAMLAVQLPFLMTSHQPWRGAGMVVGAGGSALRALGPQHCAAWFDGTLFNADELRRSLAIGDDRPLSAADLGLRAYQRWGVDFLHSFMGEFVCAVWDAPSRRLILGCDAMGERPLHYWQNQQMVLWAGELRGLLTHPLVPRQVDEERVAEMVANVPLERFKTIYRDIFHVPGGHVLVLEPDQPVRLHRYWHPLDLPLLTWGNPDDYAAALRDTLEQAVIARLPKSGSVSCDLSGGLDSSTVAALAARYLAGQGRKVLAFTAVPGTGYDRQSPSLKLEDEGPLAASVAAMYPNMEHYQIANDSVPWMRTLDQIQINIGIPARNTHTSPWGLAIDHEVRKHRLSTLLTAGAGNLTASYDGLLLPASLLGAGRWRQWAASAMNLRRRDKSWLAIAGMSLGPFAPAFVMLLRRLLKRDLDLFQVSPIRRDLAAALALDRRFVMQSGGMGRVYTQSPGGDSRVLRMHNLELRMRAAPLFNAYFQRSYGVTHTDPTNDRKVVELCLCIPEEQFMSNGQPRSLIRRAMAGLLPTPILQEQRRGIQSADWYVGFGRAQDEIVEEVSRLEASPLAQRILDIPRLRRLVEDWPKDGLLSNATLDYRFTLSRGIAMGRFLRGIEGGNG